MGSENNKMEQKIWKKKKNKHETAQDLYEIVARHLLVSVNNNMMWLAA